MITKTEMNTYCACGDSLTDVERLDGSSRVRWGQHTLIARQTKTAAPCPETAGGRDLAKVGIREHAQVRTKGCMLVCMLARSASI